MRRLFAPGTAAVFPFVLALAAASCSPGAAPGSGGGGGAAPDAGDAASGGTGGTQTSSSTGGELPHQFTVTGVVTDGENPVADAIVMQGGGTPAFTTGPDGAFNIELTQDIPGTPTVVATKQGYRTVGVEFLDAPSDGPIEIVIRYVTPPDNINYVFGDPGKGSAVTDNSTKYCGHCHTTFVAQFQTSAHAKATRDPLVQDLYAGVTEAYATQAACQAAGGSWRVGLVPGTAASTTSKCYLGGGVLPDLNLACGGAGQLACDNPALPAAQKPTAFARCADCHAPGLDGVAGGRNLHEAVGIPFENGNHCDVCHHARDVDLTKPPGVAGALVLQRPHDTVIPDDPSSKVLQAMFGPLLDVPNGFMGGSYQPKFKTAELCGACHEQKQEALVPGTMLDSSRWPDGLPTHSTHTEWTEGSFNTPGTPCQFCHMPPDDTGMLNTIDVTTMPSDASITFGFLRPPEQIRKHIFRSPLEGSPRFIDQAVQVTLAATSDGTNVDVEVHVKNTLAGHAIPTGEPMRSLVLVVDAEACGAPMVPSGGRTLDDIGGLVADGMVGAEVSVAGSTMTWAAGAALAKVGNVVRLVRPTGTFDDYVGIGFFANAALSPAEKGIEIRTPVGEAAVLAVGAGTLTMSAALAVQVGDIVYLGDALAAQIADGDASRALAGKPGATFARVLVDPSGERQIPHYRAIDMASDNRIMPQATAVTAHQFAVPAGCASGKITATLIYRPIPVGQARLRGWDARDYVVGTAMQDVPLP